MIISHRYKFIFFHNYKVAGTSIKKALKKFSNLSFREDNWSNRVCVLTGIYPFIYSRKFDHHITALELKNKITPRIFSRYFKFGFVRDPWDWQVSLYTYMLKEESNHQHRVIKKMKNFDEYIEWRVHKDLHLQKDFFYDKDECIVDFIGRFESLNQDFYEILKKIKINTELPYVNISRESGSHLNYYTPKTIDIVYDAFIEDIKKFGYRKPILK